MSLSYQDNFMASQTLWSCVSQNGRFDRRPTHFHSDGQNPSRAYQEANRTTLGTMWSSSRSTDIVPMQKRSWHSNGQDFRVDWIHYCTQLATRESTQMFVGNRVAQIMELIPPERWGHVLSADNPADCASRGLYPAAHTLWWNGPEWLRFGQVCGRVAIICLRYGRRETEFIGCWWILIVPSTNKNHSVDIEILYK